jgi:flagellar motor switch protein FliM
MSELLSNEEIETLLDMFRAEGVELDDKSVQDLSRVAAGLLEDDIVVNPVDLLKPNRVGRDVLSALERYLENGAKSIASCVSDRLRIDVSCDCVSVEQLRFGRWLEQITTPVAIYVLEMSPLPQPVLLSVTTGMLYGAVDRILGGTGQVQRVPLDFTAAEFIVADALVGPCLDCITTSIKDIVELRWEIKRRFCNVSMAQVMPGRDIVVAIHFQIGGEVLSGDLRLVLPLIPLEPHLVSIDRDGGTGMRVKPGSMRDIVAEQLMEVRLGLSVQLGETRVPLRNLIGLAEGDVIALDTRVGDDLIAPVQGRPKLRGQVGVDGNRYAFRVVAVDEAKGPREKSKP